MGSVGVKWSLIVSLLVYTVLLISRNTRLAFSNSTVREVRNCCEERVTDISDSRLSNFGSDSGPSMDSSELLVDRVIPLTKTLNRFMDRIIQKFSLQLQLDDNKIISFRNDVLNLTFFESNKVGKARRVVYGKDAMISRLDSLRRLGNTYIALNTESDIIIAQKLRFDILKYKYDYYDEQSKLVGRSSFIYPKNIFLLNLTLSTNYDNSQCKVSSVDFILISDSKECTLKVDGLIGTNVFYDKLNSVLFSNFVTKVLPVLNQVVLPTFTNLIQKADICSYFDAKSSTFEIQNKDEFVYEHV